MADINISDIVFDAMLKEAVTANFNEKMKNMPPEEELRKLYPFSEVHIHKMKAIFRTERRRETLKKIIPSVKAAVIIVCVIAACALATLMANPDVRAAARDAIVRFFKGYTSIGFTDDENTQKEARNFKLGYVPEGYELINSSEFGENVNHMYMDENENMLVFYVGPPGTFLVDDEQHSFRIKTHGGVDYYIFESFTDDIYSTIVWAQDGFSFSIFGLVPFDELFEAALSTLYED